MRRVGRFLVVVLAVVGGIVILLAGAGGMVAWKARPTPLPQRMVLMLDLTGGLGESDETGALARLEGHQAPTLKDVVPTLQRAARDPRVTGLVARFGDSGLGMAQAQELRDSVAAFRAAGKRTVAFAPSLGETGAATVPYYAASAFGEVWVQPSATVGLTGFLAQSPFFKDTLDMLGVKPEFAARWEYKSAIETFTHHQFSKEAKESLELLVNSWSRQVTEGIAQSRKLSPQAVTALIDRAPLLAAEAKDGGLLDRLAYWDELDRDLTAHGARIVDLGAYQARLAPESGAAKVALILGVGPVQSHDDANAPFGGVAVFASDRVARAFHDAAKDPTVKAILFRISSPGGSYVASDAIWHAVSAARAAGKPVVVSMGNVAASGGYFAAMAADRVVAEPGTITGSIGVFTGKMVLADLWKKLGVGWDEVGNGRNAGIWSANEPFSPSGWERVNAILDHIYADFTTKAAAARHLSPQAIDALARGRIWPGDTAQDRGLIDEIGGIATAEAAIRHLTSLPEQTPIDLVAYPKPKTPLQYLLTMLRTGQVPEGAVALARLQRLVAVLEPLAALADTQDGTLRMPPVYLH